MDHPAERQDMPQKPSSSRPAGNSYITISGQGGSSLIQVKPTCRLRVKLGCAKLGIRGPFVHIKERAGRDSLGGVIR